MDKKSILIFAGCTDKKLISKISPILDSSLVKQVYLVRNIPLEYSHPKLKQYPPLHIFRKIVFLREINRVLNGIYLLLTKKIDILLGIHFLMHGVYTYYLSEIFKKKHIFLFIESPQKYRKDRMLLRMLSKAWAIGVRGNNSMRYLIEKGIPKEKFFIPPNEFDIPDIKIEEEKKVYDLIYIGNFVDEKDLPLWVNVIKEVKEKMPGIKSVMLGDGVRFNMIKEMVKENNLEGNIDMVGRKKDVYKYINQSKILLMTSKSEGLPMTVVEAMSLGVPSVLPDVGDITDLVEDGKNGILIDSRNPIDYANAIINILENEEILNRLGKESIVSIKKMSENTTHSKLIELWNTVLKDI